MKETPTQKYVQEMTNRYRTESFKNHVATLENDRSFINWRDPKSSNYFCHYIIHRRWLICVGDIGEAVFEWSQDLRLDFLSSLNLDYFLGKCRASPYGGKFEQWDPRTAWHELKLWLGSEGNYLVAKATDDLTPGSCKDDYEQTARRFYEDIGDAETANQISTLGMVPSSHAIGMFVGLQMAAEQLREKP